MIFKSCLALPTKIHLEFIVAPEASTERSQHPTDLGKWVISGKWQGGSEDEEIFLLRGKLLQTTDCSAFETELNQT